MRNRVCFMGVLVICLSPVTSFASPGLTVTPNGNDTVLLQGGIVKEMATVEVSFNWNKTLGEPRVSLQGGTISGIVPNDHGGMTIKVIRDDPDAELNIEVGFDNPGNMSGALSNVVVQAQDAGGSPHPLPVDYVSPEVPLVRESPKEQVPAPIAGEAPATGRGELLMPESAPRKAAEVIARSERPSLPDEVIVKGKGAFSAELQEKVQVVQSEVSSQPSVLQRFLEYRGKRGLREFTALFMIRQSAIRQEPAIAITDGKTPVKLTLELDQRDGYTPNFALSDAKLVSLRNHGGSSWIMTVIPNKGAWEVRLLLSTGTGKVEFPLVVAPPVAIPTGINDSNFLFALNRYLIEEYSDNAAGSDPSRQNLRQYIFTANYLARTSF